MRPLYNAVMRIRINLKSVLIYSAYALALVCLNCAVPGVPFSLGACFGMLICGTNIIITPVIYALASIVTLDWVTMLLALFEGAFLTLVTLIYRRSGKKIRFEAVAYVAVALAPFVAFSRWKGIEALPFTQNAYVIKAIAAVAVMLFTFFCSRAVYSLLFRLCRCKLRADELLFISIVFTVCGIGAYNLLGGAAYACLCAGLIAFSVRLSRSPAAVIAACVIGVPCAMVTLNLNAITAFVLLSVFALLFLSCGRAAPSVVCAVCTALILYLYGSFTKGAGMAVLYALLLICSCLAAALPSNKYLRSLNDLLSVKKVLPRTQEERFSERVSEKLFRTSEVFREIECAFTALDDEIDLTAIKRRMFNDVKRQMCENCRKKGVCAHTGVYRGISSLIEAGCAKGKVSLVDLPAEVTVNCVDVTVLIDEINKLLSEYRKLAAEAENVRSGRKLLADQAKGVADVLKSRAVELCRVGEDSAEQEKAATELLASNGISCPEIRIIRGENTEVSVTVVGKQRVAPVKDCLEKVLGAKLILQDKICYDAQKSAYVFVNPPRYDAAFGVAYAVKEGEKYSGDTHSVVKINEHSFLMALSDGMGSGEYAQKVSSTAISLIEAFYRAEMPADVVLDTINKLLCFNRDERFTCIDVAAVDLNSLTASFIKIGSPAAAIVRKGEIKVMESRSLPLGILDSLHPTTCKENLKCGDIIVFMSDGVTSAFATPAELYDFLQTLKPLNPQSLAEKILAAAKERVLGTPDDMTVLCVRIFKREVE